MTVSVKSAAAKEETRLNLWKVASQAEVQNGNARIWHVISDSLSLLSSIMDSDIAPLPAFPPAQQAQISETTVNNAICCRL